MRMLDNKQLTIMVGGILFILFGILLALILDRNNRFPSLPEGKPNTIHVDPKPGVECEVKLKPNDAYFISCWIADNG